MSIRFTKAGTFNISGTKNTTGTWVVDEFDRTIEFDDLGSAPDDAVEWVIEEQEKWLNCLCCPYEWQHMTFYNDRSVSITNSQSPFVGGGTVSAEVSLLQDGIRPRFHASFSFLDDMLRLYEHVQPGIEWIRKRYQEEDSAYKKAEEMWENLHEKSFSTVCE